jgi:hypothetical protein
MGHAATHVAVVTADIIGSSRYSQQDRRRLDGILRRAFEEVERRFRDVIHTRLAFRITAGDEFQFVVSAIPEAFTVLMYLRALVAAGGFCHRLFRASLGVGEIGVPARWPVRRGRDAFVRSRRGLRDRQGGSRVRWFAITEHEIDSTADVVLCLVDYMLQSWTVPQWEAIRWSLLGLTREEIARKLRRPSASRAGRSSGRGRAQIAHQNVTKRLLAAGWPYFQVADAFLRRLLEEAGRGTRREPEQANAP